MIYVLPCHQAGNDAGGSGGHNNRERAKNSELNGAHLPFCLAKKQFTVHTPMLNGRHELSIVFRCHSFAVLSEQRTNFKQDESFDVDRA